MDKIVRGVKFTDVEYDELLQYLLEDSGLTERTSKRPELRFLGNQMGEAPASDSQVRLVKIFNMENINALVPGQTLTFGPGLTAVFGANGSGKSGYARVLGCAGFTRGDREVLPDVTQPFDETARLTADIEITDRTSSKVIHYEVGNPCPELRQFYVFDSTSVQVHLTGSNTFSFSPAGLACLKQMADVTDRVRERLRARIDESSQTYDFRRLFPGESMVSKLVDTLSAETDVEEIRRLARMTQDEKQLIKDLDLKNAELKTTDIPAQMRKMENNVNALQNLIGRLDEAESRLGDNAMGDIKRAVKVCIETGKVAQRISIDQFKSPHLTQIGSDAWYRFLEAAKALATAEQVPDEPYPQEGDVCLLCQQPLSSGARDLLVRLWEFLEAEAQERFEQAKDVLREKRSELSQIELDFFSDQLVSYKYLE
ncbi:MAG: hypothetical protein WBF13_10240, partial [Candidatus Zixiibacteriota bacterium]